MKPWSSYIVVLLLFLPAALSCPAQEEPLHAIREQEERLAKDSDDVETLKNLIFLHLHKADYRKAVDYGERLLRLGYEKSDFENAILYAHIGLGQAYTMLGDSSAYNHLGQARISAETAKNDSALCSAYNGMGLYAINIDKDNYSALHYFFQGLETAKRCNYERLKGILLANISSVYFLKRDTVGLTYSLEAYKLGHEQSSPYLIYIGASTIAYLYYLQGKYDMALRYIKEAEFLMQQNDFYDQGNIYAIYGRIVGAQGDTHQAIELFQKGLAREETNQTSSRVLLLHGYAQALQAEKKHKQAVGLLLKALSLTHEENNQVYRSEVIDALSACYAETGNYAEAFKWLQQSKKETDRLYNTDKEKIIGDLRIKYDSERMENEIQQSKFRLLKKEKHEQLLVGVLLIIALVTSLMWIQYRRKNRLYKSIVRQNRDALRREQQLQDLIQTLQHEKYSNSALKSERKSSLFQRLEDLMREKAIYKDNQLTKDKAAELLETNRTYLSQVINEQTGQTFTQYVNQHRLNEAIRLLNDTTKEMPLKVIAAEVGFSSMSTFYKLFQNSVGMPPRQYRETVLKLKQES